MQPIRIIIVDDHEVVRKGLKSCLQEEPDFFVTGEAGDGAGLDELIQNTVADVILLDDRLPGDRGINICAGLTKRYPNLKVIILTAYAEHKSSIPQAVIAGAKGFVMKNTRLCDLKRAIRAVAGGDTVLDPKATEHLVDCYKEMHSSKNAPGSSTLSEQQMAVARLVAQGFTNREIAGQLFLSENTIKFHLQNIMHKLGAQNRTALVSKLLNNKTVH